MRGKKELLLLILGFVLFIFDLVTDFYVAVQYKRQGENSWFGLTLTFIIVPLFIVNLMSFWQMQSSSEGRVKNTCSFVYYVIIDITCISKCLLFCMFLVRYKRELTHWKQRYLDNFRCRENSNECNCTDCEEYREIISESNKSAYELAWLRYVETLLESTPQWCLQVYVMLSRWSFPWYTVLSTVIALLSLAWSNVGLEKARANKDGHDFNLKSTFLYFISQLAVLVARLFSIVTCAYALGSLVFGILVIFWLLGTLLLSLIFSGYMVFSICRGDKGCCEPSTNTICKNFLLTIPLTFYVSEAALESLGFTAIWIKMFLFVYKSLENVFMLVLAVARIGNSEKRLHLDIWIPIAWSLFGIGFLFGLISLIARHAPKRREATADRETNGTETQGNAFHIPESGTISATDSAFVT